MQLDSPGSSDEPIMAAQERAELLQFLAALVEPSR
jgi:hypothetical protein